MRTTAEAKRPAAAARTPSPGRRGRVAAKPEPVPDLPPPRRDEPPSLAVTATRLLKVDEGLYALRVGEVPGSAGEVAGMALPAALVSVPFAEDADGVEIVAAFPGRGPWLGKDGGTLILRSPAGGGQVIVTAYGRAGQQAGGLSLELRRLDAPADAAEPATVAAAAAADEEPAAPAATREVPTEILLHIERAGDRLFPGRGWVGALGRRMRIEAFSIRPLEHLAPTDIEMKGFLPNGGETPWVPGGAVCGTRGRGLPLVGFAVRVAPQHAGRFDVVYQGSFFAGGISETQRNGDPCRAGTGDDPLEAINVRLIDRIPESEAAATTA